MKHVFVRVILTALLVSRNKPYKSICLINNMLEIQCLLVPRETCFYSSGGPVFPPVLYYLWTPYCTSLRAVWQWQNIKHMLSVLSLCIFWLQTQSQQSLTLSNKWSRKAAFTRLPHISNNKIYCSLLQELIFTYSVIFSRQWLGNFKFIFLSWWHLAAVLSGQNGQNIIWV